MTDDLTPLASAYLDGEATVEEIARVEGDTAALAEVERLRQVRAVVGYVDPPVISAREAHLAAALEAWDRLPAAERDGSQVGAAAAGLDPAAAAGVSSIAAPTKGSRAKGSRARSASRSNGWILAGAASLVVLLAGGLTLRSLTGDDGEDVAVESAATDPPTSAGGDAATTDPSVEPGEDITDPDTEPDDASEGAPPPEEGLEELNAPEDLAVFGSDAVGVDVIEEGTAPPSEDAAPRGTSAPDGTDPAGAGATTVVLPAEEPAEEPADFPLCAGADIVVGPAVYQGMFVIVGIDTDRNLALAYLPDDCTLVAQAPLP
jgi:hypothetical protein